AARPARRWPALRGAAQGRNASTRHSWRLDRHPAVHVASGAAGSRTNDGLRDVPRGDAQHDAVANVFWTSVVSRNVRSRRRDEEDDRAAPRTNSALMGERIRPQLELDGFARRALSAFIMPGRVLTEVGPQAATLPARGRIVDSAVDPAMIKAHRIGHAEGGELSVRQQRQQRL